MKAVVCAYGEVGHACLSELLALETEVALVVTHEDEPGENVWFASVADLAVSSGLRVIAPSDANASEVRRAVVEAAPEFLFSFYFRQMLSPEILAIPTRGALNLHGSLLPRYRGRAPVNWVLLHGETETGVTLHYMDEKSDHGDLVAQRRVPIGREETALTLTRKLAAAARVLLREVHPLLEAGTAPRIPQDHAAASYFGRRGPEDGEIDWARPAEEIRNLVRAVTDPWPGAFSWLDERKLLVWSADTRPAFGRVPPGTLLVDREGSPLVATGEGALELLDVTWEGESRRSGREWAARASIPDGARFASRSRRGGGK